MCTALLLAISLLQTDPAASPPAPVAPPADAATAAAPATDAATPAASPASDAAPAPAATAATEDAPAAPAQPAAEGQPAATPDAATAATAPAATEPAGTPAPTPSTAEAGATTPAAAEAPAATPAAEPPAAAAAVPPAPLPPVPAAAAPPSGCVAGPGWECVKKETRNPTKWGLTIDGGFPDAAGVAVLYRPWYWLRLELGGTTTVYASNGVRAGVSLVPFNFPITPALTFNYGKVFEADWNKLYAKFSTPDPDIEPVLRKFGYQYVDAHLGLEIGAPRRFVFFVRAGLTQIWTQVHGLTAAAAAQITDATTSATIADTKITLRVPSAKVGFLMYFF